MNRFARWTAAAAITLIPGVAWTDGPFDWFKAGKHRDHKGFPIKHDEEPQQACGIIEVAHSLDAIEEGIADDGIIAIKRPDVWGQNRMSQYRVEFEKEMARELTEFKINLQARVAQSDQSAFMQTSALGLSLANQKRGTSTTIAPPMPLPAGPSGDLANLVGFLTQMGIKTPDVKVTINPSAAGASSPPPPAPEKPGSPEQLAQAMEMLKQDFAPGTISRSAPLDLLAAATDALKELDQTKGGLGVEPPIYLDQKKRYLDALHQIRRVNLGDDTADSVGYGMYLVRMPVSLLPGHRTKDGWGAEVQATARHAFGNNFLPRTYKNLVINDLVDQLTPLLYELIRSGAVKTFKDPKELRVELESTKTKLFDSLPSILSANHPLLTLNFPALSDANKLGIVELLLLLSQTPGLPAEEITVVEDLRHQLLLAEKVTASIEADYKKLLNRSIRLSLVPEIDSLNIDDGFSGNLSSLQSLDLKVQRAIASLRLNAEALTRTVGILASIENGGKPIASISFDDAENKFNNMIVQSAISYSKSITASAKAIDNHNAELAEIVRNSARISQLARSRQMRTDPSQAIPVSAEDIIDFSLGSENTPNKIEKVSKAVEIVQRNSGRPMEELRTYMFPAEEATAAANRLSIFAQTVSESARKFPATTVARVGEYGYPVAPNDVIRAFVPANLFFVGDKLIKGMPTRDVTGSEIRAFLAAELEVAYGLLSKGIDGNPPVLSNVEFMQKLLALLQRHAYDDPAIVNPLLPPSVYESLFENEFKALLPASVQNNNPMVALCWAIVVDAVLLDQRLKESMSEHSGERGFFCDEQVQEHFFYLPNPSPDAEEAFESYVKARWPIVCFALDPVVQQQNIQDRFALRRDLQLAMAYAFAIGKVSFNQVNKFQRRIEYDAETIELNQTVHSFAAGNDSFGWRFTPRFQNPPMEGSTIGAFTRTVFNAAPTERYRRRHAELEPGQREVTVVLLMPSFLEGITIQTSTAWFKLNQPDDKLVSSERMLVQGQKIGQLREAMGRASDQACFRGADIEGLEARIERLENMLPMQTQKVLVPFENTQSGFDLFRPGAFGLAPRLLAFEGIERIDGVSPEKQPALSILLYGKNFHLNATEVIVGGYRIDPGSSSLQMLSREVIGVTFPAGSVFPTVMKEGDPKTYVEVHIATPNGISDGLLIPYETKKPAPATSSLSLATTELKVKFRRTPASPIDIVSVSSKLKVKWTDPLGYGPPKMFATLSYTPESRPTISASPVISDDLTSGDYEFDVKVAIAKILNDLGAQAPPLPIPGEISVKVAVVPEQARNESKSLDGTVKITLEVVSP